MLYAALLALSLSLSVPSQARAQSEPETTGLKAGDVVVFTPGTYRKAEIRYSGADPQVRLTVEDPDEFRQLEDTAIRPVFLTKKQRRFRLPSGYLLTPVPVYTAATVLELQPANSGHRNLTPIARVRVAGGPLDGKAVWVRQSALARQQPPTEADGPLKRSFADWARANREAAESARKLPPGNRLRKARGRVKEVADEVRARHRFSADEFDAFLTRAVEERWPTDSAADFTLAALALRPSSQSHETGRDETAP